MGALTESGKALFLSYASQDAEPARHLCDALRAAGIAEALVPEKFREVQWTRLPAGANAEAFVEHVRRLVSPATPLVVPGSAPVPPAPVASSSAASAAAPTGTTVPKSRSRVP